jgi:hypothetical protein
MKLLMISKKFNLFFLLILIVLASCGKDPVDTQATEINVIKPASNNIFFSGDTITFEARFTDNQALSQFKIEIHENFDNHGHKKRTFAWFYLYIGNLAGKDQVVTLDIPIPVDIEAGNYDFLVKATDIEGNESEEVELDIILKNSTDTSAPEVIITSLDESGSNEVIRGNPIGITGTATDNKGLKQLEIKLFDENTKQKVFEKTIILNGLSASFNEVIQTAPLAKGDYHLEIICYDLVRNITELEFEITVL